MEKGTDVVTDCIFFCSFELLISNVKVLKSQRRKLQEENRAHKQNFCLGCCYVYFSATDFFFTWDLNCT